MDQSPRSMEMKSDEGKYTIPLLVVFGIINLAFVYSVSYLVFLVLLGLVLRKKQESPSWVFTISILFSLLFYISITGCRCVEGAGAAKVARMIFLYGSLSGLILMIAKVVGKKKISLFTAPVILIAVAPIYTALIVRTYAALYDIHASIFYL